MNILLFGPPGAGKGTQSAALVHECGMVHVSTGNLLRDAAKRKTPVGLEAQSYMDAGKLVPDSVMIKLVEDILRDSKGKEFILDGFPRTVVQAEALKKAMVENGLTLGKAVFLDVPKELLVRRICGRRVCEKCGAVYHMDSKPPRRPGICDECGAELVQRADDTEAVVKKRLDEYEKNTSPLKEYYRREGLLAVVEGTGTVPEIFQRIRSVLQSASGKC